MIIRIGAWVIEETMLQMRRWGKQGIEDVSVAVNLSARQFLNWNMVNYIKKTMSHLNIPANLFEVEVTESAAMKDIEMSKKILDDLHESGIPVSLDDFGTGYSSLSYLKQFPISKLKIDQSFIRELPDDTESAAIVSALIALGHAINLKIVAEGVEKPGQLQYVQKEKADYVQGYILSRAIIADEVPAFISEL